MDNKNSKTKTPLKLTEIARELRRIADELEEKKFATGAGRIDIEDPTFLKTRRELKGDTAYFSLSIRMALAGATARAPKPAKSIKTGKSRKERSSGSGEAKKVKKEINRLWKGLRQQIKTRALPNPTDGKSLLKLWENYTLFAEATWSDEWRDCKGKVEQCLRAAANEKWPEAETAVTEVMRLTKECHRQHK